MFRKMKSTLLVLALVLISQTLGAQNLRNDSCAKAVLSEGEIASYSALLIFSEARLESYLGHSIKQNSEYIWREFLNSSGIDSKTGSIEIPWMLKSQNQFIGKINSKLQIDSLWIKSWSYSTQTKDTVDYFYLNFKGSLGRLYSSAAKENEQWKHIWTNIESAGEIPAHLLGSMFDSKTNTLLKDPKMKLLITLYMMTALKNA